MSDVSNKETLQLVVIGNGMAGVRTIEELLKASPSKYEITIIGEENSVNYNRIMLSPILAGEKTLNDIVLNTQDWYEQHNITLLKGDPAVQIDRHRKIVSTKSAKQIHYDKLILATGSQPFIAPFPGHDLNNVLGFRTVKDVDRMLAISKIHRTAVVIGGGLLGLEAASGLNRQGMDVTVLHSGGHLLNRQLDQRAATLLRASLEQDGIAFKLNVRTESLTGNAAGDVTTIKLTSGEVIPADLVVFATGVTPNIELAKQANLQCERGILVSDTLQTFDPSIYAVGECIQHRGTLFGLVAPLFEQAKVCANHLAELGFKSYATKPTATKLKVSGLDVYSAGIIDQTNGVKSPEGTPCEYLQYEDRQKGIYKKLVLKDNKLIGIVLFGDIKEGAYFFDLIQSETNISAVRHLLIFGKAYCEAHQKDASMAA